MKRNDFKLRITSVLSVLLAVISLLLALLWVLPNTRPEPSTSIIIGTESEETGSSTSLNTAIKLERDSSGEAVVARLSEDCYDSEYLASLEYPDGLTEIEFKQAAELLMASPDPQHKFAGTLLTYGEEQWSTRIERFDVALAANQHDPVMLSLAFAECDREHFEGWCEEHGVEELLIEADPNNGESWAIIANRRLANGDKEGGLIAMEQAAGSADTNAYFAELFGVVERGLAAAGVGDTSNRFMIAMGFAAAQIRSYGMILKICEEESVINYRWRSACMSFGKKLEQQARTQIDVLMGTALQSAVLTAEGDSEGLREIELRRERQRNLMFQSAKHGFHKVLFSDVRLLSRYMNELMTKSEYDAQVFLAEEQRKWLESQCIHTNVDTETDSQENRE